MRGVAIKKVDWFLDWLNSIHLDEKIYIVRCYIDKNNLVKKENLLIQESKVRGDGVKHMRVEVHK